MLAREMDPYSLYLHIPFCRHRCSYCDFNTFAGQERMVPAYIDALCSEIRHVAVGAGFPIPVHTVFFGGGTPSLLSAEDLGKIISTLRQHFQFLEPVEITLEANPGTVSPAYLQELRGLGINRLSYGMQSAHPDDLRLLERQHDYFDVLNAVRWARESGFQNLNLDLIFGLPGQSCARWQDTVDRAVAMAPDHLSLYSLTIEHGTPLQKRWARGMIPLVDDDLSADMYEFAMDRLPSAGYEQYEISNWARRGEDGELLSCRHNLQYWHNLPYLGLGAGAHGFAAGFRTMNVGGIRPYIARCADSQPAQFPAGLATRRTIPASGRVEMQETMMVGLRLTQEGVPAAVFQKRFDASVEEVFGEEIRRLLELKLLEWIDPKEPRLRLTRRGRMLGNQVFMQFVG